MSSNIGAGDYLNDEVDTNNLSFFKGHPKGCPFFVFLAILFNGIDFYNVLMYNNQSNLLLKWGI